MRRSVTRPEQLLHRFPPTFPDGRKWGSLPDEAVEKRASEVENLARAIQEQIEAALEDQPAVSVSLVAHTNHEFNVTYTIVITMPETILPFTGRHFFPRGVKAIVQSTYINNGWRSIKFTPHMRLRDRKIGVKLTTRIRTQN